MRKGLVVGLALVCAGCDSGIPAQFDYPFAGRQIIEHESITAINEDPRCLSSWDYKPGVRLYACSWHFDDGLNPGKQACHIVLPPIGDPNEFWAMRTESANCNGWHDREVAKAKAKL